MQLTFYSHTNADMIKKLAISVKRGHDGIAREGKVAGALSYGYDAVTGKPGERPINKVESRDRPPHLHRIRQRPVAAPDR